MAIKREDRRSALQTALLGTVSALLGAAIGGGFTIYSGDRAYTHQHEDSRSQERRALFSTFSRQAADTNFALIRINEAYEEERESGSSTRYTAARNDYEKSLNPLFATSASSYIIFSDNSRIVESTSNINNLFANLEVPTKASDFDPDRARAASTEFTEKMSDFLTAAQDDANNRVIQEQEDSVGG